VLTLRCECGHKRADHKRGGHAGCLCARFRWRVRTALSALHTPLDEIAERLESYRDDGPAGWP